MESAPGVELLEFGQRLGAIGAALRVDTVPSVVDAATRLTHLAAELDAVDERAHLLRLHVRARELAATALARADAAGGGVGAEDCALGEVLAKARAEICAAFASPTAAAAWVAAAIEAAHAECAGRSGETHDIGEEGGGSGGACALRRSDAALDEAAELAAVNALDGGADGLGAGGGSWGELLSFGSLAELPDCDAMPTALHALAQPDTGPAEMSTAWATLAPFSPAELLGGEAWSLVPAALGGVWRAEAALAAAGLPQLTEGAYALVAKLCARGDELSVADLLTALAEAEGALARRRGSAAEGDEAVHWRLVRLRLLLTHAAQLARNGGVHLPTAAAHRLLAALDQALASEAPARNASVEVEGGAGREGGLCVRLLGGEECSWLLDPAAHTLRALLRVPGWPSMLSGRPLLTAVLSHAAQLAADAAAAGAPPPFAAGALGVESSACDRGAAPKIAAHAEVSLARLQAARAGHALCTALEAARLGALRPQLVRGVEAVLRPAAECCGAFALSSVALAAMRWLCAQPHKAAGARAAAAAMDGLLCALCADWALLAAGSSPTEMERAGEALGRGLAGCLQLRPPGCAGGSAGAPVLPPFAAPLAAPIAARCSEALSRSQHGARLLARSSECMAALRCACARLVRTGALPSNGSSSSRSRNVVDVSCARALAAVLRCPQATRELRLRAGSRGVEAETRGDAHGPADPRGAADGQRVGCELSALAAQLGSYAHAEAEAEAELEAEVEADAPARVQGAAADCRAALRSATLSMAATADGARALASAGAVRPVLALALRCAALRCTSVRSPAGHGATTAGVAEPEEWASALAPALLALAQLSAAAGTHGAKADSEAAATAAAHAAAAIARASPPVCAYALIDRPAQSDAGWPARAALACHAQQPLAQAAAATAALDAQLCAALALAHGGQARTALLASLEAAQCATAGDPSAPPHPGEGALLLAAAVLAEADTAAAAPGLAPTLTVALANAGASTCSSASAHVDGRSLLTARAAAALALRLPRGDAANPFGVATAEARCNSEQASEQAAAAALHVATQAAQPAATELNNFGQALVRALPSLARPSSAQAAGHGQLAACVAALVEAPFPLHTAAPQSLSGTSGAARLPGTEAHDERAARLWASALCAEAGGTLAVGQGEEPWEEGAARALLACVHEFTALAGDADRRASDAALVERFDWFGASLFALNCAPQRGLSGLAECVRATTALATVRQRCAVLPCYCWPCAAHAPRMLLCEGRLPHRQPTFYVPCLFRMPLPACFQDLCGLRAVLCAWPMHAIRAHGIDAVGLSADLVERSLPDELPALHTALTRTGICARELACVWLQSAFTGVLPASSCAAYAVLAPVLGCAGPAAFCLALLSHLQVGAKPIVPRSQLAYVRIFIELTQAARMRLFLPAAGCQANALRLAHTPLELRTALLGPQSEPFDLQQQMPFIATLAVRYGADADAALESALGEA